ncbi:hypothetical protein [Microtetraspora glauca]|uniref:DUF3108 domain-containing protein n=1 Tax=Microtetraspora glauca TaxID=1996 RepID=A0ABV3GQH6_MICGL
MSRYRYGVIDYVGDDVGVRGREEWTLSVAEDGTRTLRAHCRMWDTEIERDVVHTASAEFRPLRSFISHRVAGEFLGEGWFVFGAETLESELLLGGTRRSQRVALTTPPPFFVPHAVCCDAWIVPSYDVAAGGSQRLSGGFRSSPRPNGATGPYAEEMSDITATLLGEETITVPAGTFLTWHFLLTSDGGAREDLWTSRDGDWLMVRLRSDRLSSTYELTELREEADRGRGE